MAEKIRTGLVGCGNRGIHAFLELLKREEFSQLAEVTSVYDVMPSKMDTAEKYLGHSVVKCSSAAELAACRDVDAVLIASLDQAHAEAIIPSMKHDKHILCDKPLVSTVAQGRKVLAAALKYKGTFMSGFEWRFNPVALEFKKMISDGSIGQLNNISFLEQNNGHFVGWQCIESNTGGLLVHKSCHMFDLMSWFAGARPRRVTGFASRRYFAKGDKQNNLTCKSCPDRGLCPECRIMPEGPFKMYEPKCPFRAEADSHDTVCLSVEYDNGVLCTFNEVYYAPEETCVINAYGPRGQIHVDLHRANLTRQERMKRMDADSVGNGIFGKTYDVRFPLPKAAHGGSDYLMMKAFLETLQHGIAHPEATTLQEGIDTMALGIAARTAIKTGQVVNVQDILAAG